MAGEGDLSRRGEDPGHGHRGGAVEEHGLGEPEFSSDGLHVLARQAGEVGHHPEVVASPLAAGEDPENLAVAHDPNLAPPRSVPEGDQNSAEAHLPHRYNGSVKYPQVGE